MLVPCAVARMGPLALPHGHLSPAAHLSTLAFSHVPQKGPSHLCHAPGLPLYSQGRDTRFIVWRLRASPPLPLSCHSEDPLALPHASVLPNPAPAHLHLHLHLQDINATLPEGTRAGELTESVLRMLAHCASGDLNPMAAMFGGIVGQEVVKAVSGKFHPLHQW